MALVSCCGRDCVEALRVKVEEGRKMTQQMAVALSGQHDYIHGNVVV
jgi:hypothetical protein